MADREHRNRIVGNELWDADGKLWTTKHSRWTTAAQAGSFAKRGSVAGWLDGPGAPIRWMTAEQTRAWWDHANDHFEVPGRTIAGADDQGRTFAVHIWRRADARLIVFETYC